MTNIDLFVDTCLLGVQTKVLLGAGGASGDGESDERGEILASKRSCTQVQCTICKICRLYAKYAKDVKYSQPIKAVNAWVHSTFSSVFVPPVVRWLFGV